MTQAQKTKPDPWARPNPPRILMRLRELYDKRHIPHYITREERTGIWYMVAIDVGDRNLKSFTIMKTTKVADIPYI